MKRDVDLIRHILLDLERHGAECTLDLLRDGSTREIDERTRYHLRLCIDAGLAKEIDRTASGSPCVRLTSAGHEFLDICRGEDRWQAAKWVVHQQTGGLSLSVLRAVLTKWAVEGISRSERQRRWRRTYRPYYVEESYPGEAAEFADLARPGAAAYRVDSYRYRDPYFEDESMRLVRPRRNYRREPLTPIDQWEHEPRHADDTLTEESLGVSLPINII